MPISSKHPQYESRISQWTLIRDFFMGEDQVKSKNRLYLAQLSGQSVEEYKAYKDRALFYSIIAKSVNAMVGLITSNSPSFSGDEETVKEIRHNARMPFSEIMNDMLFEMCLQTRCGILIDRGPNDTADQWPFPVLYRAEDIINWRMDNNDPFVILQESHVVPDEKDPYHQIEVTKYRELRLVPTDDGPVYTQFVYNEKGELEETVVPNNMGEPLDYIPFIPISARGMNFTDSKPLMLDVANVNLSHYRSGADLEHGRHFTGLPTPVILGAESDRKIYLGSSEVIVIPGRGTDAKFLEFTGKGLSSLEKALTEKEQQMISLSAKALQDSSNGSESPEAIMLRYSSEAASLRAIVDVAEMAANAMMSIMCDFMRRDPVEVSMSRTFMDSNISSQDAQRWFEIYLKGGVSRETLAYIYRSGGVYPDEYDRDRAADDIVASQSLQEPQGNLSNPTDQEV